MFSREARKQQIARIIRRWSVEDVDGEIRIYCDGDYMSGPWDSVRDAERVMAEDIADEIAALFPTPSTPTDGATS